MSTQNNYRYIGAFNDVVHSYNNSQHSSTDLAPADVKDEHVHGILSSMSIDVPESTPKFKVGDRVRVSTSKLTSEKGYEANYSDIMFEIVECRKRQCLRVS